MVSFPYNFVKEQTFRFWVTRDKPDYMIDGRFSVYSHLGYKLFLSDK